MAEQITREIAVRTEQWLRQRIDMNRNARFGLEDATPQQLNVVYVLCKRWGLDPVTDMTLYQGRPWITIDGHMRKMREHPDFRGIERRPLTPEEKLLGGWDKDDIVWETTISTARWGKVTEWGKVTKAEVQAALGTGRKPAPVGLHPVEIAQKRSLARCNRLAFGMDAPDEEEIEREVAEEMARRANPVVIAENAATYDRIYQDQDALPAADSGAVESAPEQEPASVEQQPALVPDPWQDNRRLSQQAEALGVKVRTLRSDTPLNVVEDYNAWLEEQIASRSVPA